MYANASTLRLLGIDAETLERCGSLMVVPSLNASATDFLQDLLQLDDHELQTILGISSRTWCRYQSKGVELAPAQADAVLRIARLVGEARRVFSDDTKTATWLKTKHPILAAKPIDLIGCDGGVCAIIDELTRVQWGDLA